jgi:hypothetical protein
VRSPLERQRIRLKSSDFADQPYAADRLWASAAVTSGYPESTESVGGAGNRYVRDPSTQKELNLKPQRPDKAQTSHA